MDYRGRLAAAAWVIMGGLSMQPANAEMPAAVLEWAGKAMAEYARIQGLAAVAVATQRSADACSVRAARLSERLAEATRLAEFSAAIYNRTEALQMQRDQVTNMVLRDQSGHSVTLYRDQNSDAYAEVAELGDVVIVVFRGTRIASLKDIAANVAQFAGAMPLNYRWADALVADTAKQFPGRRLIVTGHSLGGGMAMYSALKNPVEAVVFNPAGLSAETLASVSQAVAAEADARTTAFIARSGRAVDPVSALSLAGESSIIGRRYVIDVGVAPNPVARHEAARIAAALAKLSEEGYRLPTEAICHADLGMASR